MRNIFSNKLILCLLTGCSIVACNDTIELQQSASGSKPMEISGSIIQINETRASDQGFADGDCMGVFIVDSENGNPGELQLNDNRASNYALTYDGASNSWKGNSEIYWRDNQSSVDVYGYYPYNKDLSSISDYPFTVAADQSLKPENEMGTYEASDFLWAKTSGATQSQGVISLKYNHKLAGVKVSLTKGVGFADGEWETLTRLVTVDNTLRNATIDLATGVASPTGDFDRHITMSPEDNDIYRAVVVPQSVAAGKSIIGVTIDGTSYNLTKNVDLVYTAGKLHNFTITVNKRAASGTYSIELTSESISEWINDESSHHFSLSAYIVVHVEKEGTLEQCLTDMKCNFETLRNLKITGNLTDADFTFIRERLPYLYALNLHETRMKNIEIESGWDIPTVYGDDMLPKRALSNNKSIRTLILPESINRIGEGAVSNIQIINVLVIPNSVKRIDACAFGYIAEKNLEIVMPDSLEYIGDEAFYHSQFKCELKLPNTLRHIGAGAFSDASNFYGHFRLPDNLEHLGTGWYEDEGAFAGLGSESQNITGDIVIPKTLTEIPNGAFNGIGFAKGTTLTLHDGITKIGTFAFANLKFNAPIRLPESLTVVHANAFTYCRMQGNLSLPKNLSFIGDGAFRGAEDLSSGLIGDLIIPKNISVINRGIFNGQGFTSVTIPDNVTMIRHEAFKGLEYVKTISIGKNIDYLGDEAFAYCHNLQTLICLSPTPPTVSANTFEDLYFDKIILEVPGESIELYRNTPGWSQFRNITEHKELAYNISKIECLQKGITREGVVRSEGEWEVVEAPDWCTVTPMSGGQERREEVCISIDPMTLGSGTREGRVVFRLKGSDYQTYTTVKQYDYEYAEDTEIVLQEATEGARPVPIFIVGEGFDAEAIANGSYLELMRQQMEHFFNIEPYRTYRNYFKVMTSVALSPDKGIIMAGETASENKFNTCIDDFGLHIDQNKVIDYVRNITGENDISRVSILILGNMKGSYTSTFRDYYWDNRHISFCSMSEDSYPYDQRGLIQHEFGGHNFADLGDENVEHFEFIKACTCPGCNGLTQFHEAKRNGGYENLSLTNGVNTVPWKHLIFDPRYSDIVDIYEGGQRHARGAYRSEIKSCMGTYIPYYNTISREAIVRRIMSLAGLQFDFEEFVAKDSREGMPERNE